MGSGRDGKSVQCVGLLFYGPSRPAVTGTQRFNHLKVGCANSYGWALVRCPHAPAPNRKWLLIFFLWRKKKLHLPALFLHGISNTGMLLRCLYTVHRPPAAAVTIRLGRLFAQKNPQRQCCLLTQLMTTPGLVSGPAQYSYSAGKRPQEGQTINTVLLMFNLSLDALDVEKTSVYMLWSIK